MTRRLGITVAIIIVLSIITRGFALDLTAVVIAVAVGLDLMYAINRDRRYRYTPFPLTRCLFRAAVGPRRHYTPTAPQIPDEPVGERHSRYIPNDVKAAVMRRDRGICRQCGSSEGIHFDHIWPWSKGGTNTVNNIQLLCDRCNLQKGARASNFPEAG